MYLELAHHILYWSLVELPERVVRQYTSVWQAGAVPHAARGRQSCPSTAANTKQSVISRNSGAAVLVVVVAGQLFRWKFVMAQLFKHRMRIALEQLG